MVSVLLEQIFAETFSKPHQSHGLRSTCFFFVFGEICPMFGTEICGDLQSEKNTKIDLMFLKKDMFLFLGNKKSRQIGLDISFPPEWGFPKTFLGQPFWGDLFEEN